MFHKFLKYISQSISGMIGVSVYILADTFFISYKCGADGLAALNLILPVFGLVFAIGSMIGIGSATRYNISTAKGSPSDYYFTQSIFWCLICSIPFMLTGIFIPHKALALLGADAGLIRLGRNYMRIVLLFTPFFMSNYTFTAFARNDHATSIAMIGSISGSFFTIIFNILILRIAGNIGIAAYGVVANISLVAMAILNGLAQGAQPLISQSYGKGEHDLVRKFLNWSLAAALLIELVIVVLIYGFTDTFISIFNSEHNLQLLAYAHTGLRLYFLGFLVAGINIVLVAYFSAIDRARPAVLGSVMRGIIAIAFCAILFSQILGLNGIWLSFLGSEIITFFVILIFRKS